MTVRKNSSSLRYRNVKKTGGILTAIGLAATMATGAAQATEGSYSSSENAIKGSMSLGSSDLMGSSLPDIDPGNFYSSLPDFVEGKPGEILKQRPTNFALGIPKLDWTGSKATQVAYVSTDPNGETIPVTGTVYQSSKPWKGEGPRPLLVIAPGTQGTNNACAPSRLTPWGVEYEGLPAAQALLRGWDVAVTDLPGLGTNPPHTYMNRVSQGNATLDMGRAAKNLGLRDFDENTPVATWGYSQGGGASAAALELADDYAPDLKIVGGYAGGVPANLAVVATSIDSGVLAGALGYTINGMLYTNPELKPEIDKHLNEKGKRLLERTKNECITDSIMRHAYVDTSTLTKSGESINDILEQEPIKSAVDRQLIGTMPPSVPVYIGHGTHDDTIPVTQARDLAHAWADGGTPVYYQEHNIPTQAPSVDHILPMTSHMDPAIKWLEKVVNGQNYPTSDASEIPQPEGAGPDQGMPLSGVTLSK